MIFGLTGAGAATGAGRGAQVEYAIEAIKLGTTAVGLCTKEGVVLAVEKRISSPLLVPKSVEKVMEVDTHIGCAMSGLSADAQILVQKARTEAQNHRFTYNESIPVDSLVQSVCDLSLSFGESGGDDAGGLSRPFGVALLVAGWDAEEGPCLFHTDPSGTYVRYKAQAIGTGDEGARNALKEGFREDMGLEEAQTLCLSTLKQVMEEKITCDNVDMAVVAPEYKMFDEKEIEAVLERVLALPNPMDTAAQAS